MMWKLTVRSPQGQPKVFDLKPGVNAVGRQSSSDIYVEDISASRRHAEIHFDPALGLITVRDNDSRNGTYVNQQRIETVTALRPADTIRIGASLISLTRIEENAPAQNQPTSAQRYTRDLLFESLDRHAVLLYEIARQLNPVVEGDTVLQTIAGLMKRSLGADRCEVIQGEQINQLHELGFPESIARTAVEQRSAVMLPDPSALPELKASPSISLLRVRSALCVPALAGDEVLALIYLIKTEPDTLPFDQRDLELAVAISHQAALTIQRTHLIAENQRQRQAEALLRRFLSPQEAQMAVAEWNASGSLPGLQEQRMTILFCDIADSTHLAERIGGLKYGETLELFYGMLTDIVFARRGIIKLLGDGVMGVFAEVEGAPDPDLRAARAGLDILSAVQLQNQTGAFPGIEVGVSVNSGAAMAGFVGSRERVEYTVVGDPVNVAARLQSYARPNRLVVGSTTAAQLTQHFSLRRIGEVVLRGRDKPLQMFDVLGELADEPA